MIEAHTREVYRVCTIWTPNHEVGNNVQGWKDDCQHVISRDVHDLRAKGVWGIKEHWEGLGTWQRAPNEIEILVSIVELSKTSNKRVWLGGQGPQMWKDRAWLLSVLIKRPEFQDYSNKCTHTLSRTSEWTWVQCT